MNDIDTGKRSTLMSHDDLRIGCRIVGHFYRQQEVLGTSHDRTWFDCFYLTGAADCFVKVLKDRVTKGISCTSRFLTSNTFVTFIERTKSYLPPLIVSFFSNKHLNSPNNISPE